MQWIRLERRDLGQTTKVAFRAAKTCCKKYLNQFPRIGGAEDLTAKTNQVEVVVLDALVRGKGFMDQAGADPWDLVRGDADSDSAPANGDTAIHPAICNGPGQGDREVRIVIIRLQAVVAKIDDMMAGLAQEYGQLLLQLEAPMIRRDADGHR